VEETVAHIRNEIGVNEKDLVIMHVANLTPFD